jgi:hypothetical protein
MRACGRMRGVPAVHRLTAQRPRHHRDRPIFPARAVGLPGRGARDLGRGRARHPARRVHHRRPATGAAQGGWAVTGPRLEGTDRKGTAMLETEHSVTLLTIMEIAAPIILAGSLI